MSLTATARSISGTLRQEVVIDGQHRLITDEPSTLAVTGAARRRTSCFRRARGLHLDDARDVRPDKGTGARRGDGRRRLRPPLDTPRFQIAIAVSGDLSNAQLERLEKVARACPLRRSIEAGVEFIERIEGRERPAGRRLVATGGEP